jgi:hypothetical protein
MQLRTLGGRRWLAMLVACVACGGDDGEGRGAQPVSAAVANFNYGVACTEYHGVDPGAVSSSRLLGASAGPCAPSPEAETCAVCRGVAMPGLGELGLSGVDHYYYGSPVHPCGEQFADARLADECVAISRGTFEPLREGVTGPSGVAPLERAPGEPNQSLGSFSYSISRYELTGAAVELIRCGNVYGGEFEPGLYREREACPAAARCVTCIARREDGAALEEIRYQRASDPDLCRKLLASEDPDRCSETTGGVLLIAR